jgi:hypothetical protein
VPEVQELSDRDDTLYSNRISIANQHIYISPSLVSYLLDSKSNPRFILEHANLSGDAMSFLCGAAMGVGVDRQGLANETGMCIVSARQGCRSAAG